MTSVIMLFIELLLDIVGLVTGGIIWAHSSESKIRKAWGMLATTLSLLLLCDNIEWMWLFSRGVEEIPRFVEVPMDHLSIWHIVRVIFFFQLFSLFPIVTEAWMDDADKDHQLLHSYTADCLHCLLLSVL